MNKFSIKVEFFGIPRLRAGVAEFFVQVEEGKNDLGNVLRRLQIQLPALSNECFASGHLKKEYIVNISGQDFTRDLNRKLSASDTVLMMSSDAGG